MVTAGEQEMMSSMMKGNIYLYSDNENIAAIIY